MFVFQLQLQNMTPAKCNSMSPEIMEMSVQMQSPVKWSKPFITHLPGQNMYKNIQ